MQILPTERSGSGDYNDNESRSLQRPKRRMIAIRLFRHIQSELVATVRQPGREAHWKMLSVVGICTGARNWASPSLGRQLLMHYARTNVHVSSRVSRACTAPHCTYERSEEGL